MDSFDLVSSLQALPETNPIEVDGIQFGSTCVNTQGAGGTCLIVTQLANLNLGQVLSTIVGGIAIPVAVLGSATGVGCAG